MKNSLAVRILRGSLFLILALIASYVPLLLHLPQSTQDKADVAAMLRLILAPRHSSSRSLRLTR